ncbi:MAG: hypothetical protein IID41_03405 [Planctomycetes bacterium]|nr:hypothetical protein [Planctomycetota bacterium]
MLDYFDGVDWFPAELTVTHSDAQGGPPAVHVDPLSTLNWGAGNIDDDPLFVDPDNDDYHIPMGALVIDAGDNEAVPPDSADLDDDGDTDEPTPFDLDGNPRIVDGDGDEEADVDMGAYEFQTDLPCPWDLNGDGEVGPFDLALVLGFWGPCEEPCTPEATCTTDLDGDCATGPFDLALILGFWGPCP